MRFRILGLVLLAIALAGFAVAIRHAAAQSPPEAAWWELLLSLFCVPAAAVGLPLLAYGKAIGAPKRMPRRRDSIRFDEL